MTSIQELREHLRLVKGQGKTILIAEHRLYYLMDIADRIVYLDRGEIKGIFTPEELRRLSQAQREQMGRREDVHQIRCPAMPRSGDRCCR